MFATMIEDRVKSGQRGDLLSALYEAMPEVAKVMGIKQMISIDRGDDRALTLVIYESQAAQEAASERGQEILGALSEYFGEAPVRSAGEVLYNEIFDDG